MRFAATCVARATVALLLAMRLGGVLGQEAAPLPDPIVKPILTLNPGHHVGAITSLSFTPDGKSVISAGDRTVQIWDVVTGERLRILRLPIGGVQAAALAPDGKTLLVARFVPAKPAGPAVSVAYLLNLGDGRIVPLSGEDAEPWGFAAATFAADGDRAFVSGRKSCWVWTGLKDVLGPARVGRHPGHRPLPHRGQGPVESTGRAGRPVRDGGRDPAGGAPQRERVPDLEPDRAGQAGAGQGMFVRR